MKEATPFKNALYLFTGEIISHLLGFASTFYIAQRVGVINFGWINFSLSLISYGLILTNFGLLTLGVRNVSQNTDAHIPSKILTLRFLLSIIIFFILFIFTTSLRKPNAVKHIIYLYSFFLFINALSLEWFFQAREKMAYIGIIRVLTALAYLILLLFFVKRDNDFMLVPVAYLIANGIGTILFLTLFKRSGETLRLIFNLRIYKDLFLSALPLGTTNILQVFYTYFGIILLGFIGKSKELGIYSATHRLLYFTLIIDRVISFLLLPLISSLWKSNLSKLPKLFESLSRIILFSTLPVTIMIIGLSSLIISLLFGKDYIEGTNILRILILFLPLTTLSTLYATALIAGNREKSLLFNTLFGTFINIILSPLLYSLLNSMGISLAFVAGEFIILTLNLLSVKRTIRFSLFRSLLPVISRREIEFLQRRRI